MIKTYYGYKHIPDEAGKVHGGLVKFQRLQRIFPNSPEDYNILYMGSSSVPDDAEAIVACAKSIGAKFVWNQNGVGAKSWAPGWEVENFEEIVNRPMASLMHKADYIVYQSEFAKRSADIFLGKAKVPYSILYNACDTDFFKPLKDRGEKDKDNLILLLGGTQYHWDKIDTAFKTLAVLKERGHKVKLLVTGKLCWPTSSNNPKAEALALMDELNIKDNVEIIGFHSQKDAPLIYNRASILIHPTYNDVCPGLVVEAMSCGLPIVYSKSGGVPELVGEEAGIGIEAPESYEEYIIPDPEKMADAIIKINKDLYHYEKVARQRAVEKFDFKDWVKKHREIFEGLWNKIDR